MTEERTWTPTVLEAINVGDYVKGLTETGQGAAYNYTVQGCLVCKGNTLYNCKVETDEGEIESLCHRVGPMGSNWVYIIE